MIFLMLSPPGSHKLVWTGHFQKATIDFAPEESQTQAFNSVGTQRKKKYSVKRFLLDTLHFFLLLCVNITIKYQSLGLTCTLQEVNLYLKHQSTNHTDKAPKTLPLVKLLPFFALKWCISATPKPPQGHQICLKGIHTFHLPNGNSLYVWMRMSGPKLCQHTLSTDMDREPHPCYQLSLILTKCIHPLPYLHQDWRWLLWEARQLKDQVLTARIIIL